MLDITIKECDSCDGVETLRKRLDKKICLLSNRLYDSEVYLVPKGVKKRELKTLLYYKNILNNLYWNSSYYDIKFETIISKIKSLI